MRIGSLQEKPEGRREALTQRRRSVNVSTTGFVLGHARIPFPAACSSQVARVASQRVRVSSALFTEEAHAAIVFARAILGLIVRAA